MHSTFENSKEKKKRKLWKNHIQSFFYFFLKRKIRQSTTINSLSQLKIAKNSFIAEIGSEDITCTKKKLVKHKSCTYKSKLWKKLTVYQLTDPYCCKIMIERVDRIGDITVGHIARKLSRFVFPFIHEGGSVTRAVAN